MITEEDIEREAKFVTSRSSGAGGQHVNKVETRVTIRFHLEQSNCLTDDEKALIKSRIGNRLTRDGFLQLSVQTYRSQSKNKALCISRMVEFLQGALRQEKDRKLKTISKAQKRKRLETKKKRAQLKEFRKKVRY